MTDDTRRKLLTLQAEAESLADLDTLTKADMDRIVDIKAEQERLSAGMTPGDRAALTEAWYAYSQAPGGPAN